MSCSALIHNAEIFGGEDSRGSQAAAGQKSSTQRELENTAKTQEKTAKGEMTVMLARDVV